MALIVEEPGVAPVERRGSQGYDDLAGPGLGSATLSIRAPGSRPEETRRTAHRSLLPMPARIYGGATGARRMSGATVDRASPANTGRAPAHLRRAVVGHERSCTGSP